MYIHISVTLVILLAYPVSSLYVLMDLSLERLKSRAFAGVGEQGGFAPWLLRSDFFDIMVVKICFYHNLLDIEYIYFSSFVLSKYIYEYRKYKKY